MSGTNIASGSHKHIAKTASSRGLSPVRSPRSSTAQRMPSPRTSPAIRPQSPLSPHYEASNRFEAFQPPSSRNMHARAQGNTQRRANTNSLRLPSLPRFHPSNFASTHSSVQTTPDATGGSPQPPVSPRTHQRGISDAQKQLYLYQQQMISTAARSSTPTQLENPESPRLAPLGSPGGPVTPLELEADGGYLTVGAKGSGKDMVASEELVEKLIKEEASRRRRASNSPSRQMNNR